MSPEDCDCEVCTETCDCKICLKIKAAHAEPEEPTPPKPATSTKTFRRKILISAVVAIASALATVGSILGQGIAYRQMRAVERIDEKIEAKCSK